MRIAVYFANDQNKFQGAKKNSIIARETTSSNNIHNLKNVQRVLGCLSNRAARVAICAQAQLLLLPLHESIANRQIT